MKLNVNLTYPRSNEFYYETRLERINLDEERKKDIVNDNGFIVGPPNGIKKDIKDPNGIFSEKFGQTLKDVSPYADRYKCQCGHLRSRINNGSICPICNTEVKYVDDNFSYFGWKVLKDPYYIIHPNLYKSLERFIGIEVLENILTPIDQKDIDGNDIALEDYKDKPKDQPFFGYGMMRFKEEFDDIMAYYSKSFSNQSKKDYYLDLMKEREKIFTQSIPVFTLLLRPINADQTNFYYEDNNGLYNMINKIVSQLNEDKTVLGRKSKPNTKLLWDLQSKYNKLYKNIEDILQSKKGVVRSLLGGRYNFTSRCVIVPDPKLRIDEVTLPYECLMEILQQRIINVLVKSYNVNYHEAYNIWYRANLEKDPMIENIIKTLIKQGGKDGRGLPVIINRNPTIAYGGIFQMYCVGMTDTYTMGVPLQVLVPLAADFDYNIILGIIRTALNIIGHFIE